MKCGIVLIFFLASLVIYVSTKSRVRHLKSRTHGSFLDTCKDVKLDGNDLLATCQKADSDTFIDTKLNLNECLGVTDGKFEWKQNGSFSKSTKLCKLNSDSGELTCKKKNSLKVTSLSYNLNATVSNIDGFLVCDGLKSTRSQYMKVMVAKSFTQTQTQNKTPTKVKNGSNY